MSLTPEPLADAIARADSTVRFTADAGEQNGPYDPAAYAILRNSTQYPGVSMRVTGAVISVFFPLLIADGDQITHP